MGKTRNFMNTLLAATLLSTGMFYRSNSQNLLDRELKIVDPLLYSHYFGTSDTAKAVLPGIPVVVNNTDTLITNLEGKVNIPITSVKEDEEISYYNAVLYGGNNLLTIEYNSNKKAFIQLINILGEEVAKIPINNGTKTSWDFKDNSGLNISNGVYLFRILEEDNNGKSDDKIIQTGKIVYIKNFPHLGVSANEIVKNDKKPFKKINTNIRIKVLGKLANGQGNYYNYDSTFTSPDSIPSIVALFPGSRLLNFSHPDPQFNNSALAFDKWFTYSDGVAVGAHEYLLIHYIQDQPFKTFADRPNMPPQYSQAWDSSKVNWEQVTSFWYNNNYDSLLFPAMELIREVQSNPDTGIKFRYLPSITYVIRDSYYPRPFPPNPPVRGPPIHTTVTMNNNISNFNEIKREIKHEWKHIFFDPNTSSRENTDRTDTDYFVKPYLGKLLMVNRSLQKFFPKGLPRFGVYKEN